MASWGLQDLKNVASAQIQNQGGEMSSAMGNQSFGGLSGTSFTCHNPLPGLQSCLQPDMPLNLLITSGLVCLWKRSLPLESSPAGAVFPVCWEPHALLPPGCAQGLAQVHGIPGKRGAQGWHTGPPPTPSWHHQRCHWDGPVGRGGYWEQTAEQSLARLGSSVPTS